jgi:Protein of unknown function (DUF3892)
MVRYRIVCTKQQPAQVPNDRAHIVAVGTGSSATSYDKYWLLSEVLAAIDRGDEFYTLGEKSGETASVNKYECPWCTQTHIRSSPDAVTDNNLDNLPTCQR